MPAKSIGATEVLSSVEDAERGDYHALIECVGKPELIEACAPAAHARGRIVIAGACGNSFSVEPIGGLLSELTLPVLRRLLRRATSRPSSRRSLQGSSIPMPCLDPEWDLSGSARRPRWSAPPRQRAGFS